MSRRWSKQALDTTASFWGKRIGRLVSEDDAKQALDAFTEFFEVLDAIDRREQGKSVLSTGPSSAKLVPTFSGSMGPNKEDAI